MKCEACKQEIEDGQAYDADGPFHGFASDCVTATARRCAEIVDNERLSGETLVTVSTDQAYQSAIDDCAAAIRREYRLDEFGLDGEGK